MIVWLASCPRTVNTFLALFAAIMFSTLHSVAAQAQLPSPKLEQVAPGVWFREGAALSHGRNRIDEIPVEIESSNSVIIEMKDYLIVVDAGYPSDARLMMEAAKTVSPKPIKYALVTHHHGDHSYGNAEWTKADVTTVGQIGIGVEILRHEPALRQNVSKWRKDVAALVPEAPELPLRIFEQSPFVLDDGQRRVEMHFFGWAHTRGDSFIYLPKEKIMCTGDALVNGAYNYLRDSSIRSWNNVLARAKALGAARVLPGHGRSGGSELFAGQMRFLTELQTAVQREIKRGRKLEELVFTDRKRDHASSAGNLQTTIRLPASVRRWVSPDRLPGQVADVYAQLTGANSSPELVSFATEDGGMVYGDLYGKGERGVVLAHGGRFNKESWERQALALAEAGYHVLAIDLRGRGQTRAGTRTDRSDEGRRFDVLAAVRYLRKSGAKNVSVIGGSMGGGAASEAAADAAPGEIDRVVLLGSEAGDKPEEMKGRKLFILCRDDKSGSGLRLPGIRKHYERSPDPKELVILDCSAHAQFIFATEQGELLMREILRFLSDR